MGLRAAPSCAAAAASAAAAGAEQRRRPQLCPPPLALLLLLLLSLGLLHAGMRRAREGSQPQGRVLCSQTPPVPKAHAGAAGRRGVVRQERPHGLQTCTFAGLAAQRQEHTRGWCGAPTAQWSGLFPSLSLPPPPHSSFPAFGWDR